MAGPVPTYVTTQTAAQTAFTVPFGLITLVNSKITAATAAGEFNTTVDCSLFVTEDVSNLRIYLDSLGYKVDFAKDTNNKSLNVDWGKFLAETTVSGTVTANQGTTPWVIGGDVNIHDSAGNVLTSTGGALDVNVSFPGTVTVNQGTSPWVVSGTVAAAQNGAWSTDRTWALSSGTDSVNVDNFPAVQPISGTVTANQGTSPWVVGGTITANAGTGPFPVSDNGGSLTVDGTVAATQSGAWSQIPDRPSQKSGRTYVEGAVSASATTTLYTVTPGKILYVTDIVVSALNQSAVTGGLLEIRDGSTLKVPFLMVTAGATNANGIARLSGIGCVFSEPKRFSTNINATVVLGTLSFSVSFTGYEE